MNSFFIVFAVLAAMVAALATAAPADTNGRWVQEPGSPTERRTWRDAGGQQVDHSFDLISGTHTAGYLALGKNAGEVSPERFQHIHSGGEASTTRKEASPEAPAKDEGASTSKSKKKKGRGK